MMFSMIKLQVLIFSQMTHMMDILEDYLELRDLLYSRLDGTMSFNVRQEQVLTTLYNAINCKSYNQK